MSSCGHTVDRTDSNNSSLLETQYGVWSTLRTRSFTGSPTTSTEDIVCQNTIQRQVLVIVVPPHPVRALQIIRADRHPHPERDAVATGEVHLEQRAHKRGNP